VNIAFDEFAGCVPVVDFEYPEDGERETPVVRDRWRPAPLAEKAIATRDRIATEQIAASAPGLRERHGNIVIHDDAERGKVVVQFAA
jgi:hypothetical protein